jgi:hypothetical protein
VVLYYPLYSGWDFPEYLFKSTFLKLLVGKGKRKREKNDRHNSAVPKMGLCWKMEGYSSEMGSDEKSVLVQF